MTTHLPAAVEFDGRSLDISYIDDTPWVRGGQIAHALGYADQKAISTIYERNASEFTETETCTLKLRVQGQEREVRVFSPRGCYLIGFLSRTPKSKMFRRWALEVLDAFRTGHTDRLTTVKEHKRRVPPPARPALPAPKRPDPPKMTHDDMVRFYAQASVSIRVISECCDRLTDVITIARFLGETNDIPQIKSMCLSLEETLFPNIKTIREKAGKDGGL